MTAEADLAEARLLIERLVPRLVEAMWLVEHGNPNWSGLADEWWKRQRALLDQRQGAKG